MNDQAASEVHFSSLMAAGIGLGLAQIKGADSLALAGVQTNMIHNIARIYGRNATAADVGGLIASSMASFAGRYAAKTLLGWIPGAGNLINSGVAASITEGIGWAAVELFSSESKA